MVIGHRPDDRAVAEAVTRERITAVRAGSPLWVARLVEQAETRPEEIDLSSLTVTLYSWGAVHPDLFPHLTTVAGPQVQTVEVFGRTEAMSCVRFCPDAHPHREAETCRGVNHVGPPETIGGKLRRHELRRELSEAPRVEPGRRGYRSGMVPGMKPPPHSSSNHGARTSESEPDLPDGKRADQSRVDDELALAPDEKPNATDGYAPADDPDWDGDDQPLRSQD